MKMIVRFKQKSSCDDSQKQLVSEKLLWALGYFVVLGKSCSAQKVMGVSEQGKTDFSLFVQWEWRYRRRVSEGGIFLAFLNVVAKRGSPN